MPALIQQTTNVYLNFAPFIINRGCKTDIKRSVHIGFFSQCFLLSCLKPTINIVTFNLELQMCRKNLNLSTSPTFILARILNDAYKCSGQILVNWFIRHHFWIIKIYLQSLILMKSKSNASVK